MKLLANPYTRIAIAAAVATLLTPRIVNALTVPEIVGATGGASIRNIAMSYGVSGAMVAGVFVVLGMAS